MNKTKIISLSIVLTLSLLQAHAQRYTLQSTIASVKTNSIEAKLALNNLNFALWNYKSFNATFLPKLFVQGTIPDYFRTINSVVQPNGELRFVGQNVASSSISFNLMQNIRATGGQLTLGSNLNRIDNFGNYRGKNYTAIPFAINYSQRNILFNEYRWERKIEPLKVTEARSEYLENLENISYTTVVRFFDHLIAKKQLRLDQQNLKNLDTLAKLTMARSEIGTVTKNDVLQAQISIVSAKNSLASSKLILQSTRQRLMEFLNVDKGDIDLIVPDSVRFFAVDSKIATAKAHANRKFSAQFSRRLLEAEQAIARAKSEGRPTFDIRVNLGITQTANSLTQSYQQLYRNQSVSLGFNIPIVDWGVNKIIKRRAETALEMEKSLMLQQQRSYDQELEMMLEKWKSQPERLELASLFQSLAQQRYNGAFQKYGLGKMTFTDFNNAQIDKDRSEIEYYNSLKEYWLCYYSLRALTLFDFDSGMALEVPEGIATLVK